MLALRTGRLYPPGTEQPQNHSAARRIMSMKNLNDTIGNRTRDLPTCSAVPQPTTPPRAPIRVALEVYIIGILNIYRCKNKLIRLSRLGAMWLSSVTPRNRQDNLGRATTASFQILSDSSSGHSTIQHSTSLRSPQTNICLQ